ncbi:MAG TPA: PKD domain-containing protein [Chitinophaga sp.]|uniref:PKD domain-containing protein n=1 Tax=Chitinophaga sp. TaxID=1869181 RepID=UPI002DBB15EE|nr:PKD domain-containing protein [Chitinophaga sp.]HEU4553896.1 PKD domain-containing protein [Chitinophaga sp.]
MPDTFNNLTGYYQALPVDYDANPKKSYPLLISVHGVGELAGANTKTLQSKVLKNGPQHLIELGKFPNSFTANGQQFSFIVISPQFKVWPGAGDIHRLVAYLQKQLRIDASRLYVTGLSMGGGVIWGAISEDPAKAKQYAAAVVVCGAYDPVPFPQLQKTIASDNTPVWALHNNNDPTVPYSYSVGWVNAINGEKPTPSPKAKLTTFDAAIHDAWSKAYDPNYQENGMNVYEWMLQYTRGAAVTAPSAPSASKPVTGNKRITVPRSSGNQVYYPNAMKSLNIVAGDTLCLAAGDYDFIQFGGLLGTAAKPIIIQNCGGLVRTGVNSTTTAASFMFTNSKYFKVEGTGEKNLEYGFDVNGTNKNGQKLFGFFFGDGTSDFDVHNAYVHDAGMFVQAKTLQQCGHPEWLEGRFVMRNVKIHHLLCRNSAWEGFYIGNTHYLWDDGSCKDMKSHHIENLEVYDNDLENMGSDGIQIAMADMGNNLVHHNRVVNYAMAKNSAHGYGILCGGGSTLRIYNNRVDKGYNCGIQIFGSGINYVYNNIITNTYFEGINVTDKLVFQPATGYIYNNTISNTGVDAIKIYADLTTVGHKVYNNLIIAPGAAGDYPQSGMYIRGAKAIKFDYANNQSYKTTDLPLLSNILGGIFTLTAKSAAVNAGRDVSDLGLKTDYDDVTRPQGGKYDVGAYEYKGLLNTAPTANAGNDIVIKLPSASATLNGTGSKDPDGIITKYSWRKKSGPAQGIIASATSSKTTVSSLVAGTYVFELTVTDNSGAINTDEVLVTVMPSSGNKLPDAEAGSDVTLKLPTNATQLYGSNSLDADGVITTYLWKKISGPASYTIAEADASNTDVTGLVAGTYVFELTVTDNAGGSSKDRVTISVVGTGGNTPPVANAGGNISITLPTSSITLNGTASKDPDGSISKYAWTKVSGPAAGKITSPAASKTTVTGLTTAGTYVFRLTVTDNKKATATDDITVTVNAAANKTPVASAGNDISITLPASSATLNGTASKDPDGSISKYAWTKVSGPSAGKITSPAASKTTVTGLTTAGTYVFRLTVTDNKNATATDDVTVTVKAAANKAPIAKAGNNISITLPTSSATLDGSASSDPDGSISKYAWTKVSGPAGGAIAKATARKTKVTGLTTAGTYVFRLTVTDNKNATATDDVAITVHGAANKAPVAKAGNNITITLPASTITLDGSGSSDADGRITKYAWTKVSGPSAGAITKPAASKTTVTRLTVAGTYVFRLTVTDDKNARATDDVTVTVKAAANKAPIANAGTNITIRLPLRTANVNGHGSYDPDGKIVSYLWTKVSGGQGTIIYPTRGGTNITGLDVGTYVYQLRVTDDDGATATDRITVTVLPDPANKAPIANAGSNITITLPMTTAHVNGSASRDADGSIKTYQWTQVSGAHSTIQWPDHVDSNITGLVEPGTYVYELKVTDNDGATATDRIAVIVKAAPVAKNIAPLAVAAGDASVQAPTDYMYINAAGSSDPDGTIVTYSWRQVSGPSAAYIWHPDLVETRISGLEAGTYVFELTVTDNESAVSKTTYTVNVLPNQTTITLDSVAMYPNPAVTNMRIMVRYVGAGDRLYFTIYDLNGRPKASFSEPVTGKTIQKDVDVTTLPAGYYIMEVKDSKGTFRWTGKFLKAGDQTSF